MKLIVDSGSTKAAWYVALPGSMSFMIRTAGINPVRDDLDAMRAVVGGARVSVESELVLGRASSLGQVLRFSHVYFYGAGCIPPYSGSLCSLLQEVFPEAEVAVESDLLGAARALCGHAEGIACILGTGANSCLYDGRDIARQTPALGWILGDEGSGAVLGRLLVGDVLKGQLPPALCTEFLERFRLTQAEVIDRVYRQPQPNRFLASLVPFLADHAEDAAVHALLVGEFRRFLVRNVAAYGRRDLPVSFVGGVAWQFRSELQQALEAEGYVLGRIEKEPIRRMAEFHQ
ncbi:MAG: ATPase [Bacteroidaceae bacterium]|nr:ATPase [Bacteroidaceae bacterium]